MPNSCVRALKIKIECVWSCYKWYCISLFRAVPVQCPVPFVLPGHAPLPHQLVAEGLGFSSSLPPWLRLLCFLKKYKKWSPKGSSPNCSQVIDLRQSFRLRRKSFSRAGNQWRADLGWENGLGVFRKFMARSSNPVKKPVSDDITGFRRGRNHSFLHKRGV